MGTYYYVVNEDKKESLCSPWAAKEWEWNAPESKNAQVVLWALFGRWRGDRITVLNDAGGSDDHPFFRDGRGTYPNVWDAVQRDYERSYTEFAHWKRPARYSLMGGWQTADGSCPSCGKPNNNAEPGRCRECAA